MMPRLQPPVGASLEVIRHHANLHDQQCHGGDVAHLFCPCRTTAALVCRGCGHGVFLFTAPGTWCHHAADADAYGPSCGVWTEVDDPDEILRAGGAW